MEKELNNIRETVVEIEEQNSKKNIIIEPH